MGSLPETFRVCGWLALKRVRVVNMGAAYDRAHGGGQDGLYIS